MTVRPAHDTLPLGGLLRDLRPARAGTGLPPWPQGCADPAFDGNPDQGDGWWCDPDRGVFGWAADPATGRDVCCVRAGHALTDTRLAGTTENDLLDLLGTDYRAARSPDRRTPRRPLTGTFWLLAHHDNGLALAGRLARRGLLGAMPPLPARPQARPDQEASRVACAVHDGWAKASRSAPVPASLVWSAVAVLVAAGVGRRVAAVWSRDGTLDPVTAGSLVAGDPAVTKWVPLGRAAGLWRAAGYDSRSAAKVAAIQPGDPGSCSKDQLVVMAALRGDD